MDKISGLASTKNLFPKVNVLLSDTKNVVLSEEKSICVQVPVDPIVLKHPLKAISQVSPIGQLWSWGTGDGASQQAGASGVPPLHSAQRPEGLE